MSLLERATSALLGRPLAVPDDLPPDSMPAGVRLRAGRLIPRIGGLLLRSRRSAAAVTLRRTIVVNPAARLTPQLLQHELTHVRQWREDRLFPLRYALATLRHGYHDNPYEVEARAAAAAASPPRAPGAPPATPPP